MIEGVLSSPEQTHRLGRMIGERAWPGAVVALVGDLGAGKTVFAKGLAEGLGVKAIVTSPTFVLMMLHEDGRMPFVHADLYRLGDQEEAELIGLPEALEGDGLSVVEWADLFPDLLPEDHLEVRLAWMQDPLRSVALIGRGPLHKRLEVTLDELRA